MTSLFCSLPAVLSGSGCFACRTEAVDGPRAQQEKSFQVAPALTEASAGIAAQDVQAESHDCHMDQSDGSDESATSPEVLVCAAADSTTPDDGGPGLWVEDRQPTEVEGIEGLEEKEEEEGGRRRKGGKVREMGDIRYSSCLGA